MLSNKDMEVNATLKEYSIDPSIWGPHVWSTIHTLAKKADYDKSQESFYKFLSSLEQLLPCETCRSDYCVLRKKMKLQESNGGAFEYSVQLHNSVNKKLGKPEISMETANLLWSNPACSYSCSLQLQKNTTNNNDSIFNYIMMLGCAILLILFVIHKK